MAPSCWVAGSNHLIQPGSLRIEITRAAVPRTDRLRPFVLGYRFSAPAPGLDEFVRCYVQCEVRLPRGVISHPVPARPNPMIVLGFGDAVGVLNVDESVQRKSPPAVLVGPQTHRRFEQQLRGVLRQFVIMFQTDGLQRLCAVPAEELTDQAHDAEAVLGSDISRLRQALGDAQSFEERVLLVNKYLFRQALRCREANRISRAAGWIVQAGGRVDIATVADCAGLSARHFARRFIGQLGVRPKLFARVVRFQSALETKALNAQKSWTEVAHNFGYYDQMHMVHDFEQLAGGTPTAMLAQLEAVFVEEIRQVRSGMVCTEGLAAARLVL